MLGVVWDDRFLNISFSHPMIRDMSKARIRKFIELARDSLSFVEIKPEQASEEVLLEVHTREYVNKLKEVSKVEHMGFLDSGDTVHYPGIFEDVLLVVGSSLTALERSKFIDQIYVPLGGFHHALPNKAMGFCPVNDVVITVKRLLNNRERVALVDVDAHHGNGVQEMLYKEKVLKINVFAYNGSFFPGTGRLEERGEGEGKGLNYNIGLPLGSGDDIFEDALSFLDLLEDFDPSYVLVVAGVDGMIDDNLKSLNLTSWSYYSLGRKVAKIQRNLGFNVISYGGGGYGENSYLGMVGFLAGLSGVSSSIVGLKREKTSTDKDIFDEARKRMQALKKS